MGCFDICVGVMVICVLVFTVFCIFCAVLLYCFVYVYLFLFVLTVLNIYRFVGLPFVVASSLD